VSKLTGKEIMRRELPRVVRVQNGIRVRLIPKIQLFFQVTAKYNDLSIYIHMHWRRVDIAVRMGFGVLWGEFFTNFEVEHKYFYNLRSRIDGE
jgi:hypothetical protein